MAASCEIYHNAISAQVDGEDLGLPPGWLDDHLATCPACREFKQRVTALESQVRLASLEPAPDLTPRVLAAIGALPARARRRVELQLRFGLAVAALVQLALSLPMLLFGTDAMGAPMHIAHELGAFLAALSVGYLVASWRPSSASGLLPFAGLLALGLIGTALVDISSGMTTPVHELIHVPTIIGFVFLWLLAAPSPHHGAVKRVPA